METRLVAGKILSTCDVHMYMYMYMNEKILRFSREHASTYVHKLHRKNGDVLTLINQVGNILLRYVFHPLVSSNYPT